VARKNRQPRANCIVELNQHDQTDPKRHVDETRKRADGVERLRHDDASPDRARDIADRFLPDELRSFGVGPCGVEERAEDNDIDPIDEKGRAVREEIGQDLVENGSTVTTPRKRKCSQARSRFERASWLSCVC
jgi:hypothetical protein